MPQACGLSSAIAVAAYLNCISCGFVFDDRLAITGNPDVLAPGLWDVGMLSHDFWGKPLRESDSHKSYRPVTTFSFRLHAWVPERTSQLHPAHFHALNVVLHALVTACVAQLAAHAWPNAGRPRASVGLLAGMLFAVHPVHVEAVTGVVGRAELLCALFCFLATAAYRASVAASLDGTSLPARRLLAQLMLGLAFVVCFCAAVLSKETGITLLGILGAHELAVALPSAGFRRGALGTLGRAVLLGCCAAAYAAMRLLLMRADGAAVSFASASLATSELIRRAENPLAFVRGTVPWLLSVGRVNCEYANPDPNPNGGPRQLRACAALALAGRAVR